VQGAINGNSATTITDHLISLNGAVSVGKPGKLLSVGTADCLQNMLPGNGNTSQFSPGDFHFGASTDCHQPSPVLNGDGTLKNQLAANVLAMQLNIWYNQAYNSRNLGVQQLQKLPVCLVDPLVFTKIQANQTTVQGLLNLSNDYLDGVGFFPPQFGNLLNTALDNLNNYWQNCKINNPCSIQTPLANRSENKLYNLNLAPNPAVDQVTLTFEAENNTTLQVQFFSNSGLQSESVFQVIKGYNIFNFNTNSFPAGIYSLLLRHDNILQTMRLVKVKD
jgi:hypothetical protein